MPDPWLPWREAHAAQDEDCLCQQRPDRFCHHMGRAAFLTRRLRRPVTAREAQKMGSEGPDGFYITTVR
jgi:hypothetical protein